MVFYYHRMRGQLSTTCSNLLKQSNEELLVAVDHNHLRTMGSETVDPFDWSYPLPSWAVTPERLVHSIHQCSLSRESTLHPQHTREPTTLPMRPLRVCVTHQLLAVMQLKLPNWQLPVAVDHSQLRTMASETSDPID